MERCERCKGTGVCPECEGSGEAEHGLFGLDLVEDVCHTCGGTGKCPDCEDRI